VVERNRERKRNKNRQMQTVYFYINGSGSPFWKEEKVDINGEFYYTDPHWLNDISEQLKKDWDKLVTLYSNYRNPIDSRFPSFWTNSMCNLFNNLACDFLKNSISELKTYTIIDKFTPLKQDERLWEYKFDPIKYHLNHNSSFYNKEDFKKYLESKLEFESNQVTDLPLYKGFIISYQEYKAFNRTFLTFEKYNNFSIEFCPLTNRTFLTTINNGGHAAVFSAMRIKREDIFQNEQKLIDLINNYLE
jgi:hypothetical protein